jgi:hypothetical protein
MARTLSKSRLMAFRQCPKRLWLQVHRPELAVVDPGMEARFASGNRVGEIAREIRPGGHLIESVRDFTSALGETQELLAVDGDQTLFEPAFAAGGALARVDVLERRGGQYRLVEVKSASSVKEQYLEDVAIQAWVVQGAGLPLASVALAHVDNTFVYGGEGDYTGLFREVELDRQIEPLLDEVPHWVASAQQSVAGEMPGIDIGPQCTRPYECEFRTWCARDEPEYAVTILPAGGKLAWKLRAEGMRDLRDVPEARLRNQKHLTVWRASRSGAAEIDKGVATFVRGLPYPRSYLDFETIGPAVPLWTGTRPYQRMPVQWSCHVQHADSELAALGALIATGADPRRAFAESLVNAVPAEGPVLAYNATFERSVLHELAEAQPEFAVPLRQIAGRLVDLLPITRDHYYHPAMKGSWSLKAVLPTIAPDLDYANLDGGVQSGQDVESVYARIIDPATAAEERRSLESALITYCARDTLALARMVAFFEAQDAP